MQLDLVRRQSQHSSNNFARAAIGWSGFTGVVIVRPKRLLNEIEDGYVMLPLSIRLSYEGSTFRTVVLEVAYNERNSPEGGLVDVPHDVIDLFVEIGLQRPDAVALLPVEHQIAQKLHACSVVTHNGTNGRAHDLVDIQLLVEHDEVDLVELDRVGRRVVAIRRSGSYAGKLWLAEFEEFHHVT